MGVKLTNKAKAAVAPIIEDDGLVSDVAETAAPAVEKEINVNPKTGEITDNIKTPKIVTSGVFMISTPDGKTKFICTSSRIETCYKDYLKWLTDSKHGNKAMQEAYDKSKGNLRMEILIVCEKADFAENKKKMCKLHGVDMKLPFSKEVVKAKDIV